MQRKILLIVATVVAAFLLCAGQVSAATANAAENKFIRALYTHLRLDYDANANACTYRGIDCDDDRFNAVPIRAFIEIDLKDRNVEAVGLPNVDDAGLRIYKIQLGGNRRLTGNLRDSWAKLTLLEEIDLSGSGFYGRIPDSWNGMDSIKEIDLSNCFFCYEMPDWHFKSMPRLREINLSRNQLFRFSSAFGSFSASTILQKVNLVNNELCGCSPSSWASNLLKNAAEQGKPGSTSAGCTGKDCTRGPSKCRTDGAAGTTSTICMALVMTIAAAVAMVA